MALPRDGDAWNVIRDCFCGHAVCDEFDAMDISPWRQSLILFDPWQLDMNCPRFDWILDPRAFAD